MAKKSKVSIDDFVFIDEEESQPLNIIAKSIHNESKPLDIILSVDSSDSMLSLIHISEPTRPY